MGSLDMPMTGVPLNSAILYMKLEFWQAMAHQACWVQCILYPIWFHTLPIKTLQYNFIDLNDFPGCKMRHLFLKHKFSSQ